MYQFIDNLTYVTIVTPSLTYNVAKNRLTVNALSASQQVVLYDDRSGREFLVADYADVVAPTSTDFNDLIAQLNVMFFDSQSCSVALNTFPDNLFRVYDNDDNDSIEFNLDNLTDDRVFTFPDLDGQILTDTSFTLPDPLTVGEIIVQEASLFNSSGGDHDFRINANGGDPAYLYDAGQRDHQFYVNNNLTDLVEFDYNGFSTRIRAISGSDELVLTPNEVTLSDGTNFTGLFWLGADLFIDNEAGNIVFNDLGLDTDFIIRNDAGDDAYAYDNGLDTHTFSSTVNIQPSSDVSSLGITMPVSPTADAIYVDDDTAQRLFKVESTGAVEFRGGTNIGNFITQDTLGAKAYRFRTSGSALDFDIGGQSMVYSSYPNGDFTGTQIFHMLISPFANGRMHLSTNGQGVKFGENVFTGAPTKLAIDNDHVYSVVSERKGIELITANTTLDKTHNVIVINATGIIVSLDPAPTEGQVVTIKNGQYTTEVFDSNGNPVEGSTGLLALSSRESARLIYSGSEWLRI